MAYIKTISTFHVLSYFALIVGLSISTHSISYAKNNYSTSHKENTSNPSTSSLPPPPSRPGMSAYEPVSYDDSITATQSDTITTSKGEGLPGSTPNQSPARPYDGPSINIPGTGIRTYFNAPVQPPYNASASYDTFAGQPGGNRDAILQQNHAR